MIPRSPKKVIEDDLQKLEGLVQLWEQRDIGTMVSCPTTGVHALQHQAEKLHYHYSYDLSQFSQEQISRYHSSLERIPEKYKINFETIAEKAREAKISYEEEKKSFD